MNSLANAQRTYDSLEPELHQAKPDATESLPIVFDTVYLEEAQAHRPHHQGYGTVYQAAQLLQAVMEEKMALTWTNTEGGSDSHVMPSYIEETMKMEGEYSLVDKHMKAREAVKANEAYLSLYHRMALEQIYTCLDEFKEAPDLIEVDKDAA